MECVTYCHLSGRMFWKKRPRHHFPTEGAMGTWNTRYAGRRMGTPDANGYLRAGINKKHYPLHRVAWVLTDGPIPEGMEVDHRNGIRPDNRRCNLRLATDAQNGCNTGLSIRNKTGVTGVHFVARRKKYVSMLRKEGVLKHLGYFSEFDDAVVARKQAEKLYFGEFARQTN